MDGFRWLMLMMLLGTLAGTLIYVVQMPMEDQPRFRDDPEAMLRALWVRSPAATELTLGNICEALNMDAVDAFHAANAMCDAGLAETIRRDGRLMYVRTSRGVELSQPVRLVHAAMVQSR